MSSMEEEKVPENTTYLVSKLTKDVRLTEMKLKSLQREVHYLERTHRALEEFEATDNALTERDPSIPVIPTPLDLIMAMHAKVAKLNAVAEEHKKLSDEIAYLQSFAEHAANKAQQAEQDYYTMVQLVGGEDSNAGANIRARDEEACGIRELTALIMEREGLRNVLDAQTAELAQLIALDEETSNTLTQKQEAERALMEKLQHISEQNAEKKALESTIHRGDWMLINPPAEDLDKRIRMALKDRELESVMLERRLQHFESQEAASRCRANQIILAERRLEMIAETVSGGLEGNEGPVDVDVLDGVAKEIGCMRVLHEEGMCQLVTLDKEIENISYRVNAIQHIINSTRSEQEKIEKAHNKYMTVVQRDMEEKQNEHENHVKALQKELASLRHKTNANGSKKPAEANQSIQTREPQPTRRPMSAAPTKKIRSGSAAGGTAVKSEAAAPVRRSASGGVSRRK